MTTPKLQMPELVVGQAGKELTHNQALAVLDQLAQAVVVDKDLATPPGSPANGAMYIVAAGATGAWAGQSGKLAFWLTTIAAWTFITPADGWSVWVTDEAVRYERKAGAWVVASGGGTVQGINRLINGNFLVNQLALSGTVTLAAGQYGHDMYKGGASGCTYTFATSGGVTTLTITAGSLIQIVEGINLQTGTHTLSWTGTAQGKIGAGSYSASGVTGSITGGTDTPVEFNTGTLSLVQLERGSVATPFEHRQYGLEFALCQRYYQILPYSFSVSASTSGFTATFMLPVPMRAKPSASVKITDAGFDSSGNPTAGQWGLLVSGTSTATRTGVFTILALAQSTNSAFILTAYGATITGSYNTLFCTDTSLATTLSARL